MDTRYSRLDTSVGGSYDAAAASAATQRASAARRSIGDEPVHLVNPVSSASTSASASVSIAAAGNVSPIERSYDRSHNGGLQHNRRAERDVHYSSSQPPETSDSLAVRASRRRSFDAYEPAHMESLVSSSPPSSVATASSSVGIYSHNQRPKSADFYPRGVSGVSHLRASSVGTMSDLSESKIAGEASPPPIVRVGDDRADRGDDAGAKKGDRVLRSRVLSLDAFRGLVIVAMILVDDAGNLFDHALGHAFWDGIGFADFVMPFFLFIVGLSLTLSFDRIRQKASKSGEAAALPQTALLQKSFVRAVKLFILGLIIQGGSFPSRTEFDLATVRIFGILQRIAVCYLVVSLMEIYLPLVASSKTSQIDDLRSHLSTATSDTRSTITADSVRGSTSGISARTLLRPFITYAWHHFVAVCFLGLNLALVYGVKVDIIECDGRGRFDPECNATGYIDRMLLGAQHVYPRPQYQNLDECQVDFPPDWCFTPFEPEGLVATIACVWTTWMGAHFGHVLNSVKQRGRHSPQDARTQMRNLVLQWTPLSVALMVIGGLMASVGIPFNKNLWSLSYNFFMVGCCGLTLSIFYVLVDYYERSHAFFLPLIWVGMNSLFIFVFGASGWLESIVKWIYYEDQANNNLISLIQKHVFRYPDEVGVLMYVLFKIGFWFYIAWYLFKTRRFFKV